MKTAIIVVSYNRPDVTQLMLSSLVKAQVHTDWELFLIDNKSNEESRVMIRHAVADLRLTGRQATFLEQDQNLGFSGGNNIGIRLALSRSDFTHICLLNNDVIVPDGWLDTLVHASENALVGPVSNSVGNEQVVPFSEKISVHEPDAAISSVNQFATSWKTCHFNDLRTTTMLGFFCVLAPISVFRTTGLLDEEFGIGTFEDDDYCLRVRAAGFKTQIVRDQFVYHWGSASFSKISKPYLRRLLARNLAYFEKKHAVLWRNPVSTLHMAYRHELELAFQTKETEKQALLLSNAEKYEPMIQGQITYLNRPYDFFSPTQLESLFSILSAEIDVRLDGYQIRKKIAHIFLSGLQNLLTRLK